MATIKLRTVTEEDACFLFSIMNIDSILEALNEVPTLLSDWQNAIQEWKNDDDEEDYIVLQDETPVGWLGINGLSSPDLTVYLKIAVLLPEYQGMGTGAAAIGQVIRRLQQRGYSCVSLYTDQDNSKAQACYRKCGFRIAEALMDESSNGKIVPRFKMTLKLSARAWESF